jgi:threonine synthase
LHDLGADVVRCPRAPDVAGDPCFARLRDELARGAIPFTCQGSENGLVIEGGETLGYEIAAEDVAIDHLVVQVGGGALASACMQALREAVGLGVLARMPRVHAVQTEGGYPLDRAYRKVRDLLPQSPGAADIDEALRTAATHRSAFMWPWPEEPQSVAGGILDDETYDWRAVVGGLLSSGGRSLVVSEDRLLRARDLGCAAGYQVDATGTAGLAGLLDLVADGTVRPDERVVVLFTGLDRSAQP